MLIVKGTSVRFDLADGTHLAAPRAYGMMHDPDGKDWPRCSVLIGPYRKSRRVIEPTKEMIRYYGKDYQPKAAIVDTPRGTGESAHKIGEVTMIYYKRTGYRAPYGFHHPFKSQSGAFGFVFRRHPAVLKERGKFFELTLPDGCIVDDRGFVFP